MPSAQFVGTNNIQSVRPATHSAGNWATSLFGSFGTGCLVPGYSANGAYVAAGTGGHGSPSNSGAIIFDFSDNTWKFQACTNSGFAEKDSTGVPGDWTTAETSGASYYEITGANNTPAPPHPYATSIGIADGAKGSLLYVTRAAVTVDSSLSTGVHAFNLATGVWTRYTANLSPLSSFDGTVIKDVANNRALVFTDSFHSFQELQYLDLGTGAFATLGSYGFPSAMVGTFSMDSTNGLIIAHSDTELRKIDLANPNAGWVNMAVTGTLPSDDNTHWCFFPPDGKFYRVPAAGGNDIGRLAITGGSTATYDTITLSGDTIPAFGDGGNVVTSPYRALIYVSSLGKMAWVSGNSTAITNNQQVTLLDVRPPPPNKHADFPHWPSRLGA